MAEIDYKQFFSPEKYTDEWAGKIVHRTCRIVGFHWWLKFARGEQHWDNVVNNDLSQWNEWHPHATIWRRNYPNGGDYMRYGGLDRDVYPPMNPNDPFFPYSPPPYDMGPRPPVRYIQDPKHNKVWIDKNTGFTSTHRSIDYPVGAFYPVFWKPQVGHKAYVAADRMAIIFTGESTGWMPIARLPQYDKNFEMAIFAHYPEIDKPIFQCTIDRPFRLYANNTDGRVRNWMANSYGLLRIFKNGVWVAVAGQYDYSSSVVPGGAVDIDFEQGDIFELGFPEDNKHRPAWLSVTIVGGLL